MSRPPATSERLALTGTFVATNDINDNELFLDAVDAVVLEALAAIGSDPEARLRFFGQLLAVAQEEAGGRYLS